MEKMDYEEVDESICPKCNCSTEDGPTINCDSCRYWFHLKCVNVTEDDDCVTEEDLPYYCPTCFSVKGSEITKYWYTCPKCPMTSTLKKVMEHSKIAHSIKSTLVCFDCKKNFLSSCPAISRKQGDDSKVEIEYMHSSKIDLARSLYYFCTYCELGRINLASQRSAVKDNLRQDLQCTTNKPILKKIKIEQSQIVQKQISMSEMKKVEGENEVYSYEADHLYINGEKTGQKIQIGMVPPDNTKSKMDKWGRGRGFKCPVGDCKFMTTPLTQLKVHIEQIHKEWAARAFTTG